jgi:hypothetical protein
MRSNTCAIKDKTIYLVDITNENFMIRFRETLISVPFNTHQGVFSILIYTDLYGPMNNPAHRAGLFTLCSMPYAIYAKQVLLVQKQER